jgi:hypothetical protein
VRFPPLQADLRQRLARHGAPMRRRLTTVDQRQFDIFQRRGAREQVETLEHEAQEMRRSSAR